MPGEVERAESPQSKQASADASPLRLIFPESQDIHVAAEKVGYT